MTTENGAYRASRIDHRNGHHTGPDRVCWRCWLVLRTPTYFDLAAWGAMGAIIGYVVGAR